MVQPPVLMVVVDTEEEFDWSSPLDRRARSVTAMAAIEIAQAIFDDFGVRPVYVVDYPVVSQEAGWAVLKPLSQEKRAIIGAHLHPWVNPPFLEEITPAHSFPGNLPLHLEREKLAALTRQIESSLGIQPVIYKAGRYGIGPNTPTILRQLGYMIDLSPAPPYDFSSCGGPDFSLASNHPRTMGSGDDILSFPATGDYIGQLAFSRPVAHRLHQAAAHPFFRPLRLPGILARTRLLERVRLSPEGFTLDEMERLTLFLLRQGLRVFSLTFHSPSLQPGCTPYVQSRQDLQRFLSTLRRYLEFFLQRLGGITRTPLEWQSLPTHAESAGHQGRPGGGDGNVDTFMQKCLESGTLDHPSL
ncbi:MAG: hypothetical protein HQL73_10660 [Magnetococcales bacterium]|nr:hypothetical protein [Magnetococcales bacterium]